LIGAGHKAKVFYAGFWMPYFEIYARSEIKSWADAKGKSFGVSSPGSLTDHLTRYMLQKNGLHPERDAKVIGVGPTSQAMQAIQAGRLDATILPPPFNWQAAELGMTRLATQRADVAEKWPTHVYYAQESFIGQHPKTLRALLRAHVRALRRAKANPNEAGQVMAEAVKFDPKYGRRTVDELIEDYDERGRLPEAHMPVFWEIAKRTGDVTEPWPKEKFLDGRFIDSFDQWKP
jgi:ABC-type nitrate/sulfonate/bicarbonate transport system substrate-binding protein